MTAASLSSILGFIGEFVTMALDWVSTTVGLVVSQPLLLIFVIVSMVGLAIGLFKRLLRV